MEVPAAQAQRDRQVYDLARRYLSCRAGITPQTLDGHLSRPQDESPDSLAGVYRQILMSALTANMVPNVILRAIGNVDRLSDVLCGFQPGAIAGKYGSDWEMVLHDIVAQLEPRGKIRTSPRSLWPRFCRTIISGAAFLTRFATANEFYEWADRFDRDERARPALPMLLSYEIVGFGFPLACNFLKDLRYVGFGKPDVHLKGLFKELGLSPSKDDYQVFKAIVRVAKNVGRTPYEVDTLFWLIGSGNLCVDGAKVATSRNEFIQYAQERS